MGPLSGDYYCSVLHSPFVDLTRIDLETASVVGAGALVLAAKVEICVVIGEFAGAVVILAPTVVRFGILVQQLLTGASLAAESDRTIALKVCQTRDSATSAVEARVRVAGIVTVATVKIAGRAVASIVTLPVSDPAGETAHRTAWRRCHGRSWRRRRRRRRQAFASVVVAVARIAGRVADSVSDQADRAPRVACVAEHRGHLGIVPDETVAIGVVTAEHHHCASAFGLEKWLQTSSSDSKARDGEVGVTLVGQEANVLVGFESDHADRVSRCDRRALGSELEAERRVVEIDSNVILYLVRTSAVGTSASRTAVRAACHAVLLSLGKRDEKGYQEEQGLHVN